MITYTQLIAIMLINCMAMFVCYRLGKMDERKDWNSLIQAGKIPRPQRKG